MIPDNYQPVEERLAKFWEKHPNGRVETELVSPPQNFEQCRYVARVWRDAADEHAAATGWAFELAGGAGANRTNHEENCETSAIGRALANLGFAPLGARPSREEMSKTTRPSVPRPQGNVQQVQQQQDTPPPGNLVTPKQQRYLEVVGGEAGWSHEDLHDYALEHFGVPTLTELSRRDASYMIDGLKPPAHGEVPKPHYPLDKVARPMANVPPRTDPQEANQQGMTAMPEEPAHLRDYTG